MDIINSLTSGDNGGDLFKAISDCAAPVVSTMGPGGKTVMLRHKDGSIDATQDGITVLRHLVYASRNDDWLNAGAMILENAAKQVVQRVGDGTTSTTLLLSTISAMISMGHDGHEINQIVNDLIVDFDNERDGFYKGYVKTLGDDSFQDLFRVAQVSTHGDVDLAEKVARCCVHVGRHGIVNVTKTEVPGVSYRLEDGYTINSGMQLPNFQNKQGAFAAKNVAVLVVGDVIDDGETIFKVIEMYRHWERRNGYGGLLIIGGGLSGSGAGGLIANLKSNANPTTKQAYALDGCSVMFPQGEDDRVVAMQDLCSVIGQDRLLIKSLGVTVEQAHQSMGEKCPFGVIDEVVCTKDKTTIKFVAGQGVGDHCKFLEDSITDDNEKEVRRRIARLTAGVAYLSIGAQDEIERGRLYDLVEDAVLACMSALRDGLCLGMGKIHLAMYKRLSYLKTHGTIAEEYSEQSINDVLELLTQVTTTVMKNKGVPGMYIDIYSVSMVDSHNDVLDTDRMILVDGWERGIFDPLMSPILSLQVAASVGANLSRTEYFIGNE